MKLSPLIFLLGFSLLIRVSQATAETGGPDTSMRVTTGKPVAVMLTCYSTTLLANGRDRTRVRIAVTDSLGREITTATNAIEVYVKGDGKLSGEDGKSMAMLPDSSGAKYARCTLVKGVCNLWFFPGSKPGKIKVEARSGDLWPASHEIHTLSSDLVTMKPDPVLLAPVENSIGRMIGADISFLPEIEARGEPFYENGREKDAIELLKDHGFNYIRLRIFVNPENEKGYSPGKGFCDLAHTLAMARRVKDAGMKLLLDFHYSDYWADPQQQFKPKAWAGLDFETLKDSLRNYTTRVLLAFKQQQTMPDMVQVGNEINHGILWPDGHISNPDQLAELLEAGVEGVKDANPRIPVMMHLALGGQHDEAVFWLDNMIARGVKFDIIGLSYYPRWHGTLDDLKRNLSGLARRYNKPLDVVEYADCKRQVHDIIFSLPGALGKGACIWEPLDSRSGLFDKKGNATGLFRIYDDLHARYIPSKK